MAIGKVKWIPDPAFEAALLRSQGLRALLEELADEGAEIAESRAPVRLGFLQDAIKGIVAVSAERGGRLIGRILSTDFKTIFWEFGTENHDAQPFLRPAGEAVVGGGSTKSERGRGGG